jgi:hypothetical protein
VQAMSRALGFASTSAQLKAALGERIEQLVGSGQLVQQGDVLALLG